MKQFEDHEYFLLKALSQTVVNGLSSVHDKVTKYCETAVLEISDADTKLEAAETGIDINKYSKMSNDKRKDLIRMLAIKNRIEVIAKRNKARIAYIDKILKDSGLYNDSFDKKLLSDIEKQETDNISKDALGLNLFQSAGDEIETKFFKGEIITLKNGVLDFSCEENCEVLKNTNDEFVAEMIKAFPKSAATIPVEPLLNSTVKKRVLKAIATYVIDEGKKKDIKTINKELGNLLEFKTQITTSPEDYIAGVTNMFNVQIRAHLIAENPEKEDELMGKLKCNEKSELIPESKRIAILGAGLSGEISSEAEESEDMRIAREKEEQQAQAAGAMVNRMFEEEQTQVEQAEAISEEQELLQDLELLKKQEEANIKKQLKQQEEEEREKEQEQMALVRSKYDDD